MDFRVCLPQVKTLYCANDCECWFALRMELNELSRIPFSFNQQYTTFTELSTLFRILLRFCRTTLKYKTRAIYHQIRGQTYKRKGLYLVISTDNRKSERRSMGFQRESLYVKASENQNLRHHKLQSRATRNLKAIS